MTDKMIEVPRELLKLLMAGAMTAHYETGYGKYKDAATQAEDCLNAPAKEVVTPDYLEAMRRDSEPAFAAAARVMDGPRQQSDAELLDYLREECNDLRCINEPTGGYDYDVRWLVISHHMDNPHERIVGRSFSDEPRDAIRSALAAEREGGR